MRRLSLLCCLALLQFTCFGDAERDNPLDPKSDRFVQVGTVTGRTLTFFVPFSPLDGVEVRLEPRGFFTQTDASGQFTFEDVPAGRYRVVARKEGYASDEDSVEVRAGQRISVDLNLDGLPQIVRFNVVSCTIYRWFPQDPLLLLEVTAELDDPDGRNDIQLAALHVPSLGMLDTLEATPDLGVFRKTVPATRLPSRNLQTLIGRELVLKVMDRAGMVTQSPPAFLARVIDLMPETQSPQGLVQVRTPRPRLVWKSAFLPFEFTYRVDLVRVDQGFTTPIWTASEISKTQTAITVPDSLTTGEYFWTIGLVDEFGNWSRSKEASFRITL